MTEVFVERHWETPLAVADTGTMFGDAFGCLSLHRVTWNVSLLSADGRELLCHFTAPDAESVRIALQQACSPRGHVWAGVVHDAPHSTGDELARANVLVSRRFEQPVVFEEIESLDDSSAACLLTHHVRLVRSLMSTDSRRMVCLYQAPDAESVRIALREARIPIEQVWAFRQFRP